MELDFQVLKFSSDTYHWVIFSKLLKFPLPPFYRNCNYLVWLRIKSVS